MQMEDRLKKFKLELNNLIKISKKKIKINYFNRNY